MVDHWYHAYVGVPGWEQIIREHLETLDEFGEVNLHVGVVGPAGERRRLARLLPSGAEIVAEEDHGFEQVTLSRIEPRDELIVYAHSKGSSAPKDPVKAAWRRSMARYTFMPSIPDVFAKQPGIEVIAPHWFTVSLTGVLPRRCSGFSPGNYWWARPSFIERLIETHPVDVGASRYDAETWIGMGRPTVASTDPRPWGDKWLR